MRTEREGERARERERELERFEREKNKIEDQKARCGAVHKMISNSNMYRIEEEGGGASGVVLPR